MFKKIEKCRVCGNSQLTSVLNLGRQYLTGVFPQNKDEHVESSPLELVKCVEEGDKDSCGLLQLKHTFNPDMMYGDNYGYRSGVNQIMTDHLNEIAQDILSRVELAPGDIILDIGSNDGTLLKAYPHENISLLGIDPSGAKFIEFYPNHIKLVIGYFSIYLFRSVYGDKKAKIVTSIAMFYDLESPLDFMRDIYDILADDGIWVFEQSYMPLMLKRNAYDTVCHEHLEYYGLRQIAWMARKTGFKIVDVLLNEINGGSFRVTVAKEGSSHKPNTEAIEALLQKEKLEALDALEPYADFKRRIFDHRDQLVRFIKDARKKGEVILGYGASTKGNVVLQFCNFNQKDINAIADRNPEKCGRVTPGSKILIISEDEARQMGPNHFLALPWHFREEFLKREKEFLDKGGRFLFPLPVIESIGKC